MPGLPRDGLWSLWRALKRKCLGNSGDHDHFLGNASKNATGTLCTLQLFGVSCMRWNSSTQTRWKIAGTRDTTVTWMTFNTWRKGLFSTLKVFRKADACIIVVSCTMNRRNLFSGKLFIEICKTEVWIHFYLSTLFWLQNDLRWWLWLSLNKLSLTHHQKMCKTEIWVALFSRFLASWIQTDIYRNLNSWMSILFIWITTFNILFYPKI